MDDLSEPRETPGQLKFLTADDIAGRLGVTKKWVQEYTRQGTIPAIKIGRRYFYTEEAVDAAMREAMA